MQHNYAAARQQYLEILKQEPRFSYAKLRLAMALLYAGEVSESQVILEELLAEEVYVYIVISVLVVCLRCLCDYQQAMALADFGLQLQSDNRGLSIHAHG